MILFSRTHKTDDCSGFHDGDYDGADDDVLSIVVGIRADGYFILIDKWFITTHDPIWHTFALSLS